jgi:adenylate kinase
MFIMNIIILGQQGSGKGTQAELLANRFDWDHFDTGKTLRQISKLETPLGKEVQEIVMVRKELVPSRILKEILHVRLGSLPRERGIVFDGVPRNLEQSGYFEDALLEFGRKIDKVFFVNISEEESLKRISKRWICGKCKNILIMGKDVKSDSDKCPHCAGEIMQRADDTPEGIKKRLGIFAQETMPVINHYKKQGALVEIRGEQDIEKVFEEICNSVECL